MEENPASSVIDITDGVHFSSKYAHSACKPFGIRLTATQNCLYHAPFLSVARLIDAGEDVPLDYAGDAARRAPDYKEAAYIMGWYYEKPEHDAASPALLVPNSGAIIGEEVIDVHLKQILFPVNGEYLSLVPLSSGPFAFILGKAASIYRKKNEAHHLRTACLPYGGANPQNAGRYTRYLCNTLISNGPQEAPAVRRAFAIFYKGARIALPRSDMMDLREALCRKASFFRTLATARKVKALLKNILTGAAEDADILMEYRHLLPDGEGLHHSSVDPIAAGLTSRTKDKDWQAAFSKNLASRIAEYRFSRRDNMGLELPDEQWLSVVIQRMLSRVA